MGHHPPADPQNNQPQSERPATVASPKKPVQLHTYLTRLVWICVLPLLLLTVYFAASQFQSFQNQRDRNTAARVKNIATALDRDLSARIAALQALAASPLADDAAHWKNYYRQALGVRDHFGGQVIFADLSMQMLFNTRVPYGATLPKLPKPSGRAAAPIALASGRPAVGDMFFGPIAKEPLIAIVVPILRDGQARGLLLSTIETRSFQDHLESLVLPEGATLALRDGTGAVMVRIPQNGSQVIDSAATIPGRAIAELSYAPWTVALEISAKSYHAPLIATASVLLAMVVAVGLTSIWGGRISGRRLVKAVATLTPPHPANHAGPWITEFEAARTNLHSAQAAREAMEKNLRTGEARFRALFEQAAVGIAQVAPDGRLLDLNQKFCDIVGYTRDDLLTCSFQDITHQEDLALDLDHVNRLLAGGSRTYTMEKRYLRQDGSQVWANLTMSLIRDECDRPNYFISVIEDISARKRADADLVQERDFSNAALDSLPGVFYCYDQNLKFLRWNKNFEGVTGYSGEEIARMSPLDFFAGADRELLTSRIQEVFDRGISAAEADFVAKDGARTPYYFTGQMTTIAGQCCLVGVGLDISERKGAEDRIRRLNAELEQRVLERTAQLEAVNKELEAFSYSVSHDLKAPLRGIDGYSRLLEEDQGAKLDAEGRLFVQKIRHGTALMHQLIEDLLAYSRLERRTMANRWFDLSAMIQRVMAESAPGDGQPVVTIRAQIPALKVFADYEGLAIAVRNLLGNAIKFSRHAQQPTVEIGAREEADKTLLWVRDNGIGFDMKFHDRIFDMFQRLQRAEDYPGTGIGLALVRKVVQRMGGRVWAESQPGAGATFFLELPR